MIILMALFLPLYSVPRSRARPLLALGLPVIVSKKKQTNKKNMPFIEVTV